MNFYFCEKCGKRITDVDIDKGLGRNKKLKGVYCTDCSVGVMTMDSLPMLTDADARKVLAQEAAEPGRPRAAARPRDEAAKSGRRGSETPARNKAVVYGGLGAVAAITVVIFLVLGRGAPPVVAQPKPQPAAVPNTPLQSAQPAVVPQPVVAKAAPPETIPPEAAATNPEPAPRMGMLEQPKDELTPKERYEKLVREGKIQPDAPAPAPQPASTPAPEAPVTPVPQPENLLAASPATDPSWKPLFNGTDLTGWKIAKGTCRAEGGEIIIIGGARIDLETSYSQFEFACQLYSDDSKYSEIWISNHCFSFACRDKKWHEFRAVSKDGVQASLDGATPHSPAVRAQGGVVSVYVAAGFTMKVKDLRLRDLSAKPAGSTAAENPSPPATPAPATAQPEKPPPPPALVIPSEKLVGVTTPPLNDPAWKTPLKDKVLEGWTLEKGSGVMEGVEYVLTGVQPLGAQLSTEKSYRDYEMIVQLYAGDSQPKQIRVRGSSFDFAPPEKKWHTFHVVAKDGKLEATLDGAPYRSSHGNLCARPAAPHRFASKGTLRIRELYVRELP
jgi:hypothetical protein